MQIKSKRKSGIKQSKFVRSNKDGFFFIYLFSPFIKSSYIHIYPILSYPIYLFFPSFPSCLSSTTFISPSPPLPLSLTPCLIPPPSLFFHPSTPHIPSIPPFLPFSPSLSIYLLTFSFFTSSPFFSLLHILHKLHSISFQSSPLFSPPLLPPPIHPTNQPTNPNLTPTRLSSLLCRRKEKPSHFIIQSTPYHSIQSESNCIEQNRLKIPKPRPEKNNPLF